METLTIPKVAVHPGTTQPMYFHESDGSYFMLFHDQSDPTPANFRGEPIEWLPAAALLIGGCLSRARSTNEQPAEAGCSGVAA